MKVSIFEVAAADRRRRGQIASSQQATERFGYGFSRIVTAA
jgi:hypothetical protein